MKLLIINADDFGWTDGVNGGILEAHQSGILTSTTLLASAPAFDSAVRLVRHAPRLGVGVHLNLTVGRAVARPSETPNLTDAAGRFRRSPARLAQAVVLGRVRPREIECEWAAQIEKVLRAGIAVTHLDGHKHVHMLPGLAAIVARLAQRFGIPAVRCAAESPIGLSALLRTWRPPNETGSPSALELLRQNLKARAFSVFARAFRRHMRHANVLIPMHFYGFTQTGSLDSRRLQEILRNVPEGSSELMCHPGYSDDVLRQTGTRLLGQRNTELEALTSPAVRQTIEELGIQLITFRELALLAIGT